VGSNLEIRYADALTLRHGVKPYRGRLEVFPKKDAASGDNVVTETVEREKRARKSREKPATPDKV